MSEEQRNIPFRTKPTVRLTRAESFKLDTWINAHRDEIAKGVYSYSQIADLLRQEVHPNLTKDSVKYSVRALGIKVVVRPKRSAKRAIQHGIIVQLAQIVSALQAEGFKIELDPVLREIAEKKTKS